MDKNHTLKKIKGVGDKQESFTFIIDYHLSPTPFIYLLDLYKM